MHTRTPHYTLSSKYTQANAYTARILLTAQVHRVGRRQRGSNETVLHAPPFWLAALFATFQSAMSEGCVIIRNRNYFEKLQLFQAK